MSVWDDYAEWSGLDESKLRHPAGKGIPESPEVAQARMDDEAIELANGARDGAGWQHVAVVAIAVIGLYLIVVTAAVVGEMVAGWTL